MSSHPALLRALRLPLAFLLLASFGRLPAAELAPKATPSVYAPLDFLVGKWLATLPPDERGNVLRLEAQFSRPENQQGIRFESTWLRGDQRSPYTAGLYAWDGAKGKLAMFYTDSSGSLTQGVATRDGAAFNHELTISKPDGTTQPIRTRLTKVSDDAFTNEIFLQKGSAWEKFVEVRYERVR